MSTVFFSDLGKASNDLLTKDFPTKFEAKVETKGADCNKLIAKVSRDAKGNVAGSLNPKFSLQSPALDVSTTVSTDKSVNTELTLQKVNVEGLKIKLNASSPAFDAITKSPSLSASFDYKREKLALATKVNIITPKDNSLKASLVLAANENISVGTEAEYTLGGSPQNKFFNLAVLYKKGQAESLFYRKFGASTVYGWSYHFKARSDLSFASDLSFDASKDKAEPQLHVGIKTATGNNSTLKTKFGTNGRVAFSYATTLNDFSKLTLGLDVNAADTSDHKLGASFNFNN